MVFYVTKGQVQGAWRDLRQGKRVTKDNSLESRLARTLRQRRSTTKETSRQSVVVREQGQLKVRVRSQWLDHCLVHCCPNLVTAVFDHITPPRIGYNTLSPKYYMNLVMR